MLNLTADTHGDANIVVSFYASLIDPVLSGQSSLLLGTNTSNASGTAIFHFNPNSSMYAGNYTWWPSATNATTLSNRTFVVLGSVNLTYANTTTNPAANYTQNQSVDIRVNLTSYGPENTSTFNATYLTGVRSNLTNNSGAIDSRIATLFSPYWNATHRLLDLGGIGNWTSIVNASARWFYEPVQINRSFTVFGYANVTALSATPTPVDAYNIVTMVCTVQDQHTNTPIQGYNATFWQNGTYLGSNSTNANGQATIYYQETMQGIFTALCNITDQTNIYYFAGDVRNQTALVNVTPILLTPFTPENGTQVDRDESGSGNATITLTGRTIASVPDGITIDFWANRTIPLGLADANDIYLGSNATANTYINLTFNPNSSWYAGEYVWWMNASGGAANGSGLYVVMGTVNITFTDDVEHPNSTYNETNTASFALNVTSNGPETVMEINSSYNSTLNLSLTTPVNGTVEKNTTFNGSQWNSSQYLFGYGVGIWQPSSTINSSYFYPINWTLRNFTVYGFMNLVLQDSEERYNGSVYATANTTYVVNVSNTFGEQLTNATCILRFYDRNSSMQYNSSAQYYESPEVFLAEALLKYNVTCSQQFYNTETAFNNVTMRSTVDISALKNATIAGSDTWNVTVRISNNNNYTERDIWVYEYIPQPLVPSYGTVPAESTAITGGAFTGNVTAWYTPALGAYESRSISYIVNGSRELVDLWQTGVKVYSANTSVVLE